MPTQTQPWLRAELIAAPETTPGAQLMIPADGVEFHDGQLVFHHQGDIVYVAAQGQLRSITWLAKQPNPESARRKAQWPNHGTRWTDEEREDLLRRLRTGEPWKAISTAHGRSRTGCQQEAVKQGWLDPETLLLKPNMLLAPSPTSATAAKPEAPPPAPTPDEPPRAASAATGTPPLAADAPAGTPPLAANDSASPATPAANTSAHSATRTASIPAGVPLPASTSAEPAFATTAPHLTASTATGAPPLAASTLAFSTQRFAAAPETHIADSLPALATEPLASPGPAPARHASPNSSSRTALPASATDVTAEPSTHAQPTPDKLPVSLAPGAPASPPGSPASPRTPDIASSGPLSEPLTSNAAMSNPDRPRLPPRIPRQRTDPDSGGQAPHTDPDSGSSPNCGSGPDADPRPGSRFLSRAQSSLARATLGAYMNPPRSQSGASPGAT
jgi:hypothetical protein